MIVPMPGEEKKAPVLRSKMNNGGGQDFVPPPPAEMPPMPDNPFGAPVPMCRSDGFWLKYFCLTSYIPNMY